MKIVVIDVGEYCYRLDLDTAATNSKAWLTPWLAS